MTRVVFGLRSQIALALVGVLALASTLTLAAVRPLTHASGRMARERLGLTLARAVAGEVALTADPAAVQSLLSGSVGIGGLQGVILVGPDGRGIAHAGRLILGSSHHPNPIDEVSVLGEVMSVQVLLPSRGVFVAECSLEPSTAERAVPRLILLYTGSSSLLALLVVYLLLTRWIVRPMETLTRAAERVASGRRDVVAESVGAAEVVRAADAFNHMTSELRAREEDLSARVQELEQATRDLERAQDQVVRSERLAMVGRLAAGIAHEVGNPLAAIVGLTDVLKDGGLDPGEASEFVDRIGREAQRIHRTVRELLDYARAAPGGDGAGPRPRSEHGDVAEAVEQVVRLLRPQKSIRDVRLDVDVPSGIPPVGVPTDRLVQVVLNLALNAADAVRLDPKGETADGTRSGTVTIRARKVAAHVVVDVEDNGPGIPENLRRRVFEPFFTTKPAGEGTGLGLATSAAIIEQAGGAITASGRTDGTRGVRFVVEIPIRERTSHDAIKAPGTSPRDSDPTGEAVQKGVDLSLSHD